MNSDLKLVWCSHRDALFACERWHYSGRIPVGKKVCIAVTERQKFRGAVIFTLGPRAFGNAYGLDKWKSCELARVALVSHNAPVSKIVAISLRMLKQQSPGLRLVVSYAYPTEGHHGGIYQAGGWLYVGTTAPSKGFIINGRLANRRAYAGTVFGGARMRLPHGAKLVDVPSKHKYLFPLDKKMRRQLAPLARPYPKREG